MKKHTKKKNTVVFGIKERIRLLFFLTCGLFIYSTLQNHPFLDVPHLHSANIVKLIPPTLSINLHPKPSQSPPKTYSLLPIQKAEADEKDKEFCIAVPVLLYHHIEPIAQATEEGHAQLTVDSGWFEAQLQYLQENKYTTLSADDLIEALMYGKTLPEKSIVLTLDDGYTDAYTYAYPLAKTYNMVLNLMIPTGLIEKEGYMNWQMLEEMQESGLIHNYSHTVNHVALGSVSLESIQFEISQAKEALKNKLGIESGIFTYPYGSYSDLAIQTLSKNGYIAAFTTDPGRVQCRSNIMKLKRDHVGNMQLSSYGL